MTTNTGISGFRTRRKQLPPLSSVLSWTGVVLFGLLIAFITFGGFLTITIVSGNSMLPTYQSGDMLIAVKQAEYAVDDVIVYKPDNLECDRCNIVHRIVGGDEETGWITQGDNNENTDPWMPTSDEIAGKVVQHFSFGEITFFFLSPEFWLMILSIIAVAFMIERAAKLAIQHHQHKKHVESLNNSESMVE